jgi:hypothetical protein
VFIYNVAVTSNTSVVERDLWDLKQAKYIYIYPKTKAERILGVIEQRNKRKRKDSDTRSGPADFFFKS